MAEGGAALVSPLYPGEKVDLRAALYQALAPPTPARSKPEALVLRELLLERETGVELAERRGAVFERTARNMADEGALRFRLF